MKKSLFRIGLTSLLLFVTYAALLCVPQPFFAFSVRADNLVLYSDGPLSSNAARHVLELSQQKLAASPLYSGHPPMNVFICNARWRQALFFNKDYGVGGVAPVPLSNVFLRDADVAANRLISPSGKPVLGDRTLDYFLVHEVTHVLTGRAIGLLRYRRLPQWIREGYADYVGNGSAFDYDKARTAFLAGVPEMDWAKSGLYWRYNLLVAFLLDRRHWTVQQLLNSAPPQQQVEAWVRDETPN